MASDSQVEQAQQQATEFRARFERLRAEIGKSIVGHEAVVEGVLTSFFAGGHVLLEGAPGLGKTLLVRTLAQATDLPFSRIQFTPDLMPADVTGTNLLAEEAGGRREFRFQPGPIFASILLADEINRATPKTQSAMLEAMQERSVTVSGAVRRLEEPFFVLATQNPVEMEGTYPLPEAQLDRFLLKLLVAPPSEAELAGIIDRTTGVETAAISPVCSGPEVLAMRATAREVVLAPSVREFAIRVVMATHPGSPLAPDPVKRFVAFGASPRGAQALVSAAKVRALLDSRFHVAVEDIEAFAAPALRHRILLNFDGRAEGVSTDRIVDDVVRAAKG